MNSYSSEEFIRSNWYEVFKNDIDSVKVIFFVGFSLRYDLDIRRAITSRKGLKEKTFFIVSDSITHKNEDILSQYGQVPKIGTKGFAQKIMEFDKTFIKEKSYNKPLYAFSEFEKDEPTYRRVTDIDVINLLYRGEYYNDIFVHNSTNENYMFKRDAIEIVLKLVQNNKKFIILESDLGNGKTCTMNILKYELNKLGHVFTLVNGDENINDDIDNIVNNYDGRKFIFIDNYHNNFDVLKIIDQYDISDMNVILSERSYINDLLYNDLLSINQCNEKNTELVSLNTLSNREVISLIKLLDKYNLWRKNSNWKISNKKYFIKNTCNRCLKDTLMEVFNSYVIKEKIRALIGKIKKNKNAEKILLLSIIDNLVNMNLNLDDYLYFLDLITISTEIKKDMYVNELLDIDKNRIKIKSSILANFIICNNNYSNKIIDLTIDIMNKLDNKSYNNKYRSIQFSLISFSNVQLLIKENDNNFNNIVIRYYESIKNNSYCNNNVFFWIQYANARIALKQFFEAKICLDKAEAEKKIGKEYLQYDTCYSRYLLENQLFTGEKEGAYFVFEKAHNGIYNNRNSKERWHFPLKQTYLYYEYYKKFYKTFSNEEKSFFIINCKQIYDKICEYFSVRSTIDNKVNHRVLLSKKKLEYILSDYKTREEVASTEDNK